MLKSGLLSVTFRDFSIEQIVQVAEKNQLFGIEWGADVHVKPGDIEAAKRAKELTEAAGLLVFSYGSYYVVGKYENPAEEFAPVLESACTLGATVIRVWAGEKWSFRADEAYVERVVEDTRIICDMAKEKGIRIAYEYHGNSLTDNRFSAVDLCQQVKRENIGLYWQADYRMTQEENELALSMLLPYMDCVHVSYWKLPNCELLPLAEGKARWERFLKIMKSDGKDRKLMIEFVKGNSVEQLIEDAVVLNQLTD